MVDASIPHASAAVAVNQADLIDGKREKVLLDISKEYYKFFDELIRDLERCETKVEALDNTLNNVLSSLRDIEQRLENGGL